MTSLFQLLGQVGIAVCLLVIIYHVAGFRDRLERRWQLAELEQRQAMELAARRDRGDPPALIARLLEVQRLERERFLRDLDRGVDAD